MKDPSSQKSSEPDDGSAGNGEKQVKPLGKLKLKPLVPKKQEAEQPKEDHSMPSQENKQSGMKLKHLMSPLSPHIKKVRESEGESKSNKPSIEPPSAVPINEPVIDKPPPVAKPMEDSVQQAPQPPPGQQQPDGTPAVQTGPDESQPAGITTATEAEPSGEPEEEKESKTEKLVAAPRKKSRLLKGAILLVNVLIILVAVQYFFDPLGLKIESFEHVNPVVQDDQPENSAVDSIAHAIAPIESYDDLEAISVESFVGQLGDAQIVASASPEGVIINSIFYPVGSTLNPLLGMRVEAVETTGGKSILKVVDAEGNEYEYPTK